MVICPLKKGTWTCSRAMKPLFFQKTYHYLHGDLPNQT
jgi:hypothetical protein